MTITRARKRYTPFHFSWKNALHLIFVILFIIFAKLFFNQFDQPIHFPIKDVKVFGAQHVDHKEVQRFILPLVQHGFFGIQVDTIKERLLQFSWISQVNVRRVWPDQVIISIVEKSPVARWNQNSLLSSKGELFLPETEVSSETLPQFFGPEGKQIFVMQIYSKINYLFSPLHFKISRIELTSGQVWNVTLDNGIKLTASSKDVLTRLSHFVKVYPKIVGERAEDVEYVDLRYPNGLAIKWKAVT